MVWFVLLHLVMFLVDLVTVTRRTDRDKDVEILLLRHQLQLVQRERPRSPRLSRWEKLTLAVLTAKFAHLTAGPRTRLDAVLLLFKPETVLKWHRELVRRKWTIRHPKAGGRPAVAAAIASLSLASMPSSAVRESRSCARPTERRRPTPSPSAGSGPCGGSASIIC